MIESSLPPTTLEEAIEIYAARAVSQGQAAALAGVSRSEFIEALGKARVPVFQYDGAEALEEAFRE
jgi:predicted HTH domain antitoxin